MGFDINFSDLLLFQRGEHIIEEGTEGQSAYIIVSGEVEVFKTIRGKRTLVGRLGAHELIGEICLFCDDTIRSATVEVFTDNVQVLELAKQDFETELAQLSPRMQMVIQALVQRLKKNYTQIAFLS
jgi:CRP-like cAMP-binding protein